jgi:hypothetical protein
MSCHSTRAMRIRVPSKSLKTPVSQQPILTFHAVFRCVSDTLATPVVAIRRAAVQGQVRGHSANHRRPLSHLPTTSSYTQRPTVSARVAEDSLAASLGCFGPVVAPAVVIPARTSGRRERSQIYELYDATWIPTVRVRLLLDPRVGGYSVGVPRMRLHRHHHPHRARSSESAAHGRGRRKGKRKRIKVGSAMGPQLEVGMRVRDPSRDEPLC